MVCAYIYLSFYPNHVITNNKQRLTHLDLINCFLACFSDIVKWQTGKELGDTYEKALKDYYSYAKCIPKKKPSATDPSIDFNTFNGFGDAKETKVPCSPFNICVKALHQAGDKGIETIGTDMCEANYGYYCKLSCNSGSCENYWIQTKTQAECDIKSTEIGCGNCKDQGSSTAILAPAGMPTNGFVSLCAGGPCVWIEQKTQCMGLKHYPAITTSSACEDACCGDNNCAVWQFDADGYSDQCWYGTVEFDWYPDPTYTQCRDKGSLTWSYGGIRKIPDCDPNYFNY